MLNLPAKLKMLALPLFSDIKQISKLVAWPQTLRLVLIVGMMLIR